MNKEEHTMLIAKSRPSLCDYSDAYILFNGKTKIARVGDNGAARQADERNKGVLFEN